MSKFPLIALSLLVAATLHAAPQPNSLKCLPTKFQILVDFFG